MYLGTETISGAVSIQSGGTVNLFGTTMNAMSVTLVGTSFTDTLSGYGTVNAAISGGKISSIAASGGNLTLGNSSGFDGFRTNGYLTVNNHTVVLNSLGFAQLGVLTTLKRRHFGGCKWHHARGGLQSFGRWRRQRQDCRWLRFDHQRHPAT